MGSWAPLRKDVLAGPCMYPQLPQERHLRAEQRRASYLTPQAGRCAGAMLLGHGFRIGILADPVRDGRTHAAP
jgi:hypothetical protein